jgi:hypothetical protein
VRWETTELVTIGRPVVDGSLPDLGLARSEAKAVLAKLQVIVVQSQVAEYVACHRVCPQCRVPQSLKDRRKPARLVSVALANKTARVAWAVPARDDLRGARRVAPSRPEPTRRPGRAGVMRSDGGPVRPGVGEVQ